MKLLYVLFAPAAFTGVIMLKGYNAMGCAYMACMSLFCLMALCFRVQLEQTTPMQESLPTTEQTTPMPPVKPPKDTTEGTD